MNFALIVLACGVYTPQALQRSHVHQAVLINADRVAAVVVPRMWTLAVQDLIQVGIRVSFVIVASLLASILLHSLGIVSGAVAPKCKKASKCADGFSWRHECSSPLLSLNRSWNSGTAISISKAGKEEHANAKEETARLQLKREEKMKADEDAARLKADEEALMKREDEEKEEKIKADEEAARLKADKEALQKCDNEEREEKMKADEEAARLEAEKEAFMKRDDEDAARLKAEAESMVKAEEEETARLRASNLQLLSDIALSMGPGTRALFGKKLQMLEELIRVQPSNKQRLLSEELPRLEEVIHSREEKIKSEEKIKAKAERGSKAFRERLKAVKEARMSSR